MNCCFEAAARLNAKKIAQIIAELAQLDFKILSATDGGEVNGPLLVGKVKATVRDVP